MRNMGATVISWAPCAAALYRGMEGHATHGRLRRWYVPCIVMGKCRTAMSVVYAQLGRLDLQVPPTSASATTTFKSFARA